MKSLRCRGCGRAFGWTSAEVMESRLYCSSACVMDGDLLPHEERNDLLSEIVRLDDVTLDDVAKMVGLTRQRVHQISRSHTKSETTRAAEPIQGSLRG